MVGRKPKPTALKLIRGNPGKRPLNNNEPMPIGDVNKPAFVKGKAAQLWIQYAPELERLGVLTVVDVDMFGAWCCLMAEFQESPERCNAARIAQMRALASTFGLDPSARVRLGTPAKNKRQHDPAEKYFS